MTFRHVPVLYDEVMESLNIRPDGFYVDGTTGGGGHSSGICERLSEAGTLLAVDRDTAALEASQKRLEPYSCKKIFLHSNYSEVDRILETAGRPVDGILLDLGVSSFQLDTAERGFSYMHDAPMDMRMNEDDSFTAYNVVNEYDEKELHRIIKEYGEERWASRIAQFIVRRREEKPIETTGELSAGISGVRVRKEAGCAKGHSKANCPGRTGTGGESESAECEAARHRENIERYQ